MTSGVLIQGYYPLLSLQRNLLHTINVKNEVMFKRERDTESIQEEISPLAADLRADLLFRTGKEAEKADPGSGANGECNFGCWTLVPRVCNTNPPVPLLLPLE